MKDALELVSLNRSLGRQGVMEQGRRVAGKIFEFDATMPFDDVSINTSSRLDPNTCEMVTEFKSVNLVESN